MGRGIWVHFKGEETDQVSSTPSGAAMGRSESFPVRPAKLPSPSAQHGPRLGSGPPRVGLPFPRTAAVSTFAHQSSARPGQHLSVLLVEGALKCGSMGGGSALLHGSPPEGMNQTLSLPSRSPLDRKSS